MRQKEKPTNRQNQSNMTYAWSSGNDAVWKHIDVKTNLSADISKQ